MLLIRELVYTQFIFKNLALGVQVMKFRAKSVIYYQYVCTHPHLFVGGTVNRCLPVESRTSAWFDKAKGKISRKHACRYSWTMSAITAVEEAFKVLGDPSLPMVERVRTGKDILFMADTPTRLLENATFGKLLFILCLNLIPSVMLISRFSQANYWWSSA